MSGVLSQLPLQGLNDNLNTILMIERHIRTAGDTKLSFCFRPKDVSWILSRYIAVTLRTFGQGPPASSPVRHFTHQPITWMRSSLTCACAANYIYFGKSTLNYGNFESKYCLGRHTDRHTGRHTETTLISYSTGEFWDYQTMQILGNASKNYVGSIYDRNVIVHNIF